MNSKSREVVGICGFFSTAYTTGLNASSVISYTTKENRAGHSIRFYFDSDDKLMCIYYVYARIEPHIFINSDGSLFWD